MKLTRRTTLLGLAAAASVGRTTLALASAPTDKRFVVVILRGALDGMAAVVPYGDPGLCGIARRDRAACPWPAQRDAGPWRLLRPASGAGGTARDVPGQRVAAGPRRRRSLSRAQPLRGTGLPGIRRRPPDDQRLAQPRGCRAALGRHPAVRTGMRWRSASPSRCCCVVRRRWRTGRRTGSRSRRLIFTPRLPRSTGTTRSPGRRSPRACALVDSAPRLCPVTTNRRRNTPFRPLRDLPARCFARPTDRVSPRWSSAAGTPIRPRPTG